MHMEGVSSRFEHSVDRTGEHHLWKGAVDTARRTGRLKVEGKTLTAHRVAWELKHGPIEKGMRVLACRDEPLCVRIEHLRIDGSATSKPGVRNRKGSGSMREVRPGVWRLSATTRFADGTTRRVNRTVYATGQTRAAKDLAAFVDEVDQQEGLVHREYSQMSVDEAVD